MLHIFLLKFSRLLIKHFPSCHNFFFSFNLDSVLKSKDLTLPTKICTVKAMVFQVAMYGCESWTIKNAKHWRIDALELWCWKRLFRVPWIAKRSNESILIEINPEHSLEGLMLKLKRQYFGHLTDRTNSWEKTLMMGNIEGKREGGGRGWDGEIASLTQWRWIWANSERQWRTGKPGLLQFMESQSWTPLSDWTTTHCGNG